MIPRLARTAGVLGALVGAVLAARTAAPSEDPPPLAPATSAPPAGSGPAGRSACEAPSVLLLHGVDDGLDPAVPGCSSSDAWSTIADRDEPVALHCASAGRRVPLERLLSGALPLDEATVLHVRSVFREGQVRGRRRDAFGLVGDSLTLDRNFLRPFASAALALPVDVQRALAAPGNGGRTIVDFFRAARTDDDTVVADPFVAPRAAKVGACAPWATKSPSQNQPNPVDAMIDRVSPAYAVVLYGANDALWRTDSIERLLRDEEASLSAIVDALEARGVIPVLSTVPKHLREPGWPDCPRKIGAGANEVFAAQATALSAAVAALACRRHLPLVDLRWSLDPLVAHGVGRDGVHLSAHPRGGGVLDPEGLECGYDVRNLVTLRELALVVDAATGGVW